MTRKWNTKTENLQFSSVSYIESFVVYGLAILFVCSIQ